MRRAIDRVLIRVDASDATISQLKQPRKTAGAHRVNTLEKYLTEEFPADQREIGDIDQILGSIANVYKESFDKKTAWPYVFDAKGGPRSARLSLSTTAMILDALLRIGDKFGKNDVKRRESGLSRLVFPVEKANKIFDATVTAQLVAAAKLVFDRADELSADKVKISSVAPGNNRQIKLTESGTYGPNDVFTLAWLADMCTADWQGVPDEFTSRLETLRGRITKVLSAKLTSYEKATTSPEEAARVLFDPQLDGPHKPKPAPHAFPVLRLIQATKRSGATIVEHSVFYKYFENSLHEQLSFSSIPDSRFDPAELAFCLEGMLLCRRKTVDRTILDRVLAVLTAAQNQSPYWRPVKPFLTTKQGLVLFPVSVEIANSLLRSCTIFDGEQLHDTYSSKCLGLFRRYAQWLRARAVRLDYQGKELVGWHSEHVNEADTIHLWETSQVLEFMVSYRNALHLHVARTTLVLSRFKQRKYERKAWQPLKERYEAVSTLGCDLMVYERIGDRYVVPLLGDAERKNYSMLLYGPPGTGKTTVAECIAEALGRRLITITVSDFLASGEAQLEARAKDIFTVLMAQPSCVIFFDEIDHFLLDRDSSRYSEQETAFQFMTPGMLTKLNDLRRMQEALFIVATNYEDRIDAAIKRAGRIDEKFLVLPPDSAKRAKIISGLLQELSPPRSASQTDIKRLAEASLFLGYTDIAAVVNSAEFSAGWKNRTAKALEQRARTISLEAYASRFTDGKKEGRPLDLRETPMREFLCLAAMKAQHANLSFTSAETHVIQLAARVLKISNGASADKWVRALEVCVPDIEASLLPGIASQIAKCFST